VVEQKLDRAGILVTHRLGGLDGESAHDLALLFAELRRGRDFHQFLMATLNRTIAFKQVNHIAVPVAENLHFDVARIDHGLFHEHIGRAERLGGLGHDTFIAALQVVFAVAATDTASATTTGGLEHHRVTDFFGQLYGFRDVLQAAFTARYHRDTGRDHGLARMDLVAHGPDHLSRRADEGDATPCADLGELRILGQKAIAGMQGIATGGDREIHNTVGIEIAADRVGAQIIRLVGLFDVQGAAVGV